MFRKISILLVIFTLIVAMSLSGCVSSDGQSVKLTSPGKNCRMVDVPYQEQVAYTEKEPYTVQEAYTVQEPYTEQESYTVDEITQVPLAYFVPFTDKGTFFKGLDVWAYGEVRLANADDSVGGIFTVTQTLTTESGRTAPDTGSGPLGPLEDVIIRSEFDIDMGEKFNIEYNIVPPTKPVTQKVTKFRTVTKYIDVTKYRDVTKYNEVTKYRTETKYRQEEKCD